MLITRENIVHCFLQNLLWAKEIDLATAWMTPNPGINALRRRPRDVRLRAVVGLADTISDPKALRDLADLGQLRTPKTIEESRRFHPKVYIFRGENKSVAWIGSANFTDSGLGQNEEVLLEVEDTAATDLWFNQLWGRCDLLDESSINHYEGWRKLNSSRPMIVPWSRVTIDLLSPIQLLKKVDSWNSYVVALKECDCWWQRWSGHNAKQQWSVLGYSCSWSETIRRLHSLIQKNWYLLSTEDQSQLLGLKKNCSALLGSMRGPARQAVFVDWREDIEEIVLKVLVAKDEKFPDVAVDSYESLLKCKGVRRRPGLGPGIATRLLTLARPDRFVSLNDKSMVGLECFFNFPENALSDPQNYGHLLEKIYNLKWYSDAIPISEQEREIFGMRSALLDSFFYDAR
ncbi:MAG: hypothetical protein F4X12_19050 [Acidobacteriia bacterium]|nr:hypothetical protein [Terriglobia bacterium]